MGKPGSHLQWGGSRHDSGPVALWSCVSLPSSYWESQSMDLLVFQSYPETKGATTHKERGCEGIPGTPLRMGNRGGLS